MCGFLAYFDKNLLDLSEFRHSLNKIVHRGPNSQTTLMLNNNLIFGHNRLSIVDIQGGSQPIVSIDKQISIMVNGEFYDYKKIRSDLINEGYKFTTLSDSEILINLYKKYHLNFFKYLNGEFSFIIFDKETNNLIIARDRFGIKPLHYALTNNKLIVASEAKAILGFLNNKVVDLDNLIFSQTFQYSKISSTFFKGISQCAPGECIVFNLNSLKIVNQFKYWDVDFSENNNLFNIGRNNTPYNNENSNGLNINEILANTNSILKSAIIKRVPEEVKFCTHLSGGLDSSIITSSLKDFDFESYTIKFTDFDGYYDESAFAIETSKFLNKKLNIIEVSSADILDNLYDSIAQSEFLSINGHIAAKYILNKAIKNDSVKVSLTGEGSDEFFMGYIHLKNDYNLLNGGKASSNQYMEGIQISKDPHVNLDFISKELGFLPSWVKAKAAMGNKIFDLFNDDIKSTINHEQLNYDFLNNFDLNKIKSFDKTQISSYFWIKYCLSGYILKTLNDSQSSIFGIEERIPFLDIDLINYISKIPPSLNLFPIEKAILRKSFKSQLPDSIINREKQPFMAPPFISTISNNNQRDKINNLLDNDKINKIFNMNKVLQLLNKLDNSNYIKYEPVIMNIISISVLLDKYNLGI